ncbi:Tn3 family transposase [Streptomyces sp. NPDC005953]|uniref:Tn3 family transposase n=1 Tax=Streptomyces sp. NPDC005953 TaxID=3156719 RepID=UPI0033DAD8C1
MNLTKVITHWPDMLKVAGSLVTGQVCVHGLLRMFGRDDRPTPQGAAFADIPGSFSRSARPRTVLPT